MFCESRIRSVELFLLRQILQPIVLNWNCDGKFQVKGPITICKNIFVLKRSIFVLFFRKAWSCTDVSVWTGVSHSYSDAQFRCVPSQPANRFVHQASYWVRRIVCPWNLQAMPSNRIFCILYFYFFTNIFIIQEVSFKEKKIKTTKLMDVFPSGEYRAIFRINLIKDEFLFNVSADVTNTSPDKNVFGWSSSCFHDFRDFHSLCQHGPE